MGLTLTVSLREAALSPVLLVPTRPIVSWNAAGPRSSASPSTSPSSAATFTGRVRTTPTTSPRRSVTSFRLRVQIRTSWPRRWTWMRIPSSFHSTEQRPRSATTEAASSAVEASMGRIGRKTWKPTASSPGPPSVRAMPAVSPRSPTSIRARRTEADETPAARATASTTTPSLAPWRSSPTSSRLTKSASPTEARARKRWRRSRRRWADPSPAVSATASSMASRSATVRVGSRAASACSVATVAQPTPTRPWRGSPATSPATTPASRPSVWSSSSARDSIFSVRAEVAATASAQATRSASSIGPVLARRSRTAARRRVVPPGQAAQDGHSAADTPSGREPSVSSSASDASHSASRVAARSAASVCADASAWTSSGRS